MSNAAPDVRAQGRQVRRAATLFDHMAMDGLEDAYERGKAMGVFAEACVEKFGFTREQLGRLRDRRLDHAPRRPTRTAASTGRSRRSRSGGRRARP